MDKPISVDLVLLMRETCASDHVNKALWAALQEVEAFYNFGEERALFRRVCMSAREPDAQMLEFLAESAPPHRNTGGRAFDDRVFVRAPDDIWAESRGDFLGTYNAGKIARRVRSALGRHRSDYQLTVMDQELTAPPQWRYILWEDRVISSVPMDPSYFGISDPNRIAVIKHRVRTVCLLNVGAMIGLGRCSNESCFLFRAVDSVLRLDGMVKLGSEHKLLRALRGRGFQVLSDDPVSVQQVMDHPEQARWLYER